MYKRGERSAEMNYGDGPFATTNDDPVTIYEAETQYYLKDIRITNEGDAPGFYSYTEGVWHRLPARTVIEDNNVYVHNRAIKIKREAGGPNLTKVYLDLERV